MSFRNRRKTPDELLHEVQTEEAEAKRGQLKIFLGYASGVGKSFRMFDEARRRRERGEDVVIGAMQPAVPPDVQALAEKIEQVPLKRIEEGTVMDVETLIRRHPAVCVIDGLAYSNPSGARHATRWEDVQELLAAGIGVIGSINIQYIAELREEVEAITGKRITETVPVSFIKSAQQIEIADAPPAEASAALPHLSRLRELALVLAADVVDHQLTDYLARHGIDQQFRTQERLLVCVTPRANIQAMMETALLITDRFHGELIVAYVDQPSRSLDDQTALDEKLTIARTAGARIEILQGDDPAGALLAFARSRGVTQLFVGHTQRSGWRSRILGSPIDRLIRLSRGMDVRVFPQ